MLDNKLDRVAGMATKSYAQVPMRSVGPIVLSEGERREDDLWDSPLAYLLFALLITSEWVLRKVFRML